MYGALSGSSIIHAHRAAPATNREIAVELRSEDLAVLNADLRRELREALMMLDSTRYG